MLFFRAIDVESLMGTVGGYVGLILGYTILQIPEYLTWLIRGIKSIKEGLANKNVSFQRRISSSTVLPIAKIDD